MDISYIWSLWGSEIDKKEKEWEWEKGHNDIMELGPGKLILTDR